MGWRPGWVASMASMNGRTRTPGMTLLTLLADGNVWRPSAPASETAGVDPFGARAVRAAYDAAAEDYAAAFGQDLVNLPVDRSILDAAVEHLIGRAPVLDVGCGPGQICRYLASRGAPVIGVDLAPRMLAVARQHDPGVGLVCADMRALPFGPRTCSAAVLFYSLQHVPRAHLRSVLSELRRVLILDGMVVVATHLGEGEVFSDEFLGHQIATVGGTLYSREELERALLAHSFRVKLVRQRGPLPHEHQSQRVYLIARST